MLKLYNTLTGKKEIFKPLKNKRVNLFVCGPTVYDFSHIGHARTYIAFDTIVKYLRKIGYLVFYLQNITDIDDRIIERAKQEKISFKDLSKKFEKEYLKDMKDLGVNSVSQYARATDYIKEIISQVERLLEKGFAYKISDGIYYDIGKFKDYGKLSGRTVLQAEDAVSRIDEAKEKRNRGDFCLWKFTHHEDGPRGCGEYHEARPRGELEPSWPSPWGPGRPGWHIEDTAITEKHFGPQYDIHGGANELIFPHHEAEVAQMEAISGKKPLVKYWTHTGLLTVNNVKMSKSLKNFISISDFLKNHSSRVLRLFILKSHYRSPIDYNEKAIKQTRRDLERIDEFIERVRHPERSEGSRIKQPAAGFFGLRPQNDIIKGLILKTKKDYEESMNDDFNTPKALAVIFDLIKEGNKLIDQNKLSKKDAQNIYILMREFDQVFAIFFLKKKLIIPYEINKLIQERQRARRGRDWDKADQIRQEIRNKGYEIKDTIKGVKVKKA